MAQPLRVIGLYGDAQLEIVHRPVAGVLRYCQERGGFLVRDFRMIQLIDDTHDTPPAWKGRADGVVVSVGLQASARDVADWLLSGGAPAVSVAADWFDPRIPTFYVSRPSIMFVRKLLRAASSEGVEG